MSLSYKYNLWHQIAIADLIPKPNWEFKMATLLLPLKYDKDKYRNFIMDYGTHVMDSAWVGGAALLTNYFHSCFLSEYRGEAVSSRSGSSFFGIFSKGHGGGQGSNISQVCSGLSLRFRRAFAVLSPCFRRAFNALL
jgi:hypothetical protein